MLIDPDRDTLRAFAHIAAKHEGRVLLAYLESSFDDTAADLMVTPEGDRSACQKGVMQAIRKLTFMLRNASETLAQTDDDGRPVGGSEHRSDASDAQPAAGDFSVAGI